jgi:hypothetical protein
MEITKLDAAIQQLETAITLFIEDRDALSIHTLTSAAGGILRDIGKHNDKKSSIDDAIEKYVRPEMIKEVRDKIREPQNFLKHADEDPTGILTFNPDQIEINIWNLCRFYKELTGNDKPLFLAYMTWFYAKHHNVLKDPKDKAVIKQYADTTDINNKREILRLAESFMQIQNKKEKQ